MSGTYFPLVLDLVCDTLTRPHGLLTYAMSLRKLAQIPSLAQLYRTNKLKPSTASELPVGNQEYNDKICTIQYDLTKLEVDAIVNAANARLLGGGGVDGAIHRAAGPKLLEECRTLNGCKTGSAKITDAYNLPCKKVIHAVGPVYDSKEESEPLLRGCYRTSLKLAADNGCKSIAFSAISTGIYGYPSGSAAHAALDETKKFLSTEDGQKIEKVIYCNFLDKDVDAYAKSMPCVQRLFISNHTNLFAVRYSQQRKPTQRKPTERNKVCMSVPELLTAYTHKL